MERRKLLSICVPVYNEEGNIRPLHERVSKVMAGLADRYDFELLFTDNHSTDRTFEELAELARQDRRVRVLRFSRNFGFQKSILTNYRHARGDAAMQLDCDLQDPPELIPEFLRLWEDGYKVVYGVRRSRPNENPLLHTARKAFYRLIDALSEDELPHDAGDFRLIDRVVIDQLAASNDQQPYIRGMIATMGFRQIGVTYDRSARTVGESKFRLRHLVALATDGILHHSIVPLRLATITGLVMSGVAVVAALYYAVARLFFAEDWPPGFASSTILILLSIGMNAFFMGIIGEYVGRIFKNVKNSPFTIIESVIDSTAEQPTRRQADRILP